MLLYHINGNMQLILEARVLKVHCQFTPLPQGTAKRKAKSGFTDDEQRLMILLNYNFK